MNRCAIFVLLAISVLAGCSRDISGSYLLSDASTVCWLQIVRTPDDHLSGQLILSTVKSDGHIEQNSFPLTGAVNGGNVTLESAGFLGMPGRALSGTFNRNSITLAGANLPPGTLERASLSEYQDQLSKQNKRSQEIISERAAAAERRKALQTEQGFEDGVTQLINRMQQFDSEADIHLGRFPRAEKTYQAITARMDKYLSRERQLAGNSNASNLRGQLANTALQLSSTTDQMHFQAQSLQDSFQFNIVPLEAKEERFEQGCNQYAPDRISPVPSPSEAASHKNSCDHLLSVAPKFHQKYQNMVAGFGRLEAVYKSEKAAQSKLSAEAQRIE